jgi:polyphosphate kinase
MKFPILQSIAITIRDAIRLVINSPFVAQSAAAQATLVAIEPSGVRLQINLTPGVAVAEQVLAQIDRDRDGAISKNEAASYAESLKRDLTLRMNGRKLELKLTASEFVPPAELRTGSGTIQMEFCAISGPFAAGPHRLTLENWVGAKTSKTNFSFACD